MALLPGDMSEQLTAFDMGMCRHQKPVKNFQRSHTYVVKSVKIVTSISSRGFLRNRSQVQSSPLTWFTGFPAASLETSGWLADGSFPFL